jgi:large subunit ribosomal protein L33
MAKGKGKKKAETVFLVCEETGDYNYSMRRKPGGEKLKLKTATAYRACGEEEVAAVWADLAPPLPHSGRPLERVHLARLGRNGQTLADSTARC